MERKYAKLVFETWAVHEDIELALANQDELLKTYYLPDGLVGRVDRFDAGELTHVCYWQVEPPGADILEWHSRQRPGVPCSVRSPARVADDGLRAVRVRSYDEAGALSDEREVYFADSDRPLREVTIGADGTPTEEARLEYDDHGQCRWITVLDTAGQVLYETDPNK